MRDAGLLDVLIPLFEARTGHRVKVVAVGSGQAMALGRRGETDILLVHDPTAERAFVADGFGSDRRPVMHNEFVLVGPAADPAGIRGRGIVDALRAVASSRALFVSRGDQSGTHAKEIALWAMSGTEPLPDWYRETGQGMGATLVVADQLRAYALADIGTFLGHRAPNELEVLVDGDTALFNPYHVILANPRRFPAVNAAGALALADFLVSEVAQRAIQSFGRERFGRSLFVPSALQPDTAARAP